MTISVEITTEEYQALFRDATRWRTFNEVAKKHYHHETGSIRFYLPRAGGGRFMSFEEAVDDYVKNP